METTINPTAIEQVIDKYGLFWTVKKENLLLPDGTETDYFATVRQDNKVVFGTCKDGYEVFQNWELAELVLRVAEESGLEVSRGGQFGDGARVFLQIAQEDFKMGGDVIKNWSTGINSFDGSTALKWGSTTKTISCQNTFWAAYSKIQNSVRHTRNMREMIDQSLRAVEQLQEADKSLFEKFVALAGAPANQSDVFKVVNKVTGVDITLKEAKANEEYSARKLNQAKELTGSIVSEMASKEDTLWGLWSGVTHYTTHRAGSDSRREEAKAVGRLQSIDQTIFDMLVSQLA